MNIDLPSEFELAVIQHLGEINRELQSLHKELKTVKLSILAVSHKTSLLLRDRPLGHSQVAVRKRGV